MSKRNITQCLIEQILVLVEQLFSRSIQEVTQKLIQVLSGLKCILTLDVFVFCDESTLATGVGDSKQNFLWGPTSDSSAENESSICFVYTQ